MPDPSLGDSQFGENWDSDAWLQDLLGNPELNDVPVESTGEYLMTPATEKPPWWTKYVPNWMINDWGDDAKVFAYGVFTSFFIIAYKNLKR